MFLNPPTATTTDDQDLLTHPFVRIGIVLLSLAIGFLTLDMVVRRPLLRELSAVRQELNSVESRMQELVGAKDQAWETSHLLSALIAQKRQTETARSAINGFREFRQKVESESRQTGDAIASLDRIADLQRRVIGQKDSVADVEQVLAEVVKLHERLLSEQSAQKEAVASLNRVSELHRQVRDVSRDAEQASVEVQKLADLRTKVLENSAGVEIAQQHAANLISLKETVSKAGEVDLAQNAANRLIALTDSLNATTDRTATAKEHADQLLSLRDEVAKTADETPIAFQNWQALRRLQDDMLAAGKGIGEAIETLELMTDLGDELRLQSQVINNLRRSLMDVAALETTVSKVLKVLEPLAQLKTFSRMSDAEVRAAARAILDQRGAKLTRRDTSDAASASDSPKQADDLFREPAEIDFTDRLAPPPTDIPAPVEPSSPTRLPIED